MSPSRASDRFGEVTELDTNRWGLCQCRTVAAAVQMTFEVARIVDSMTHQFHSLPHLRHYKRTVLSRSYTMRDRGDAAEACRCRIGRDVGAGACVN